MAFLENLFQPMHLIIILAIVLIVFGPGKLPDIGAAVGKSIREFRGAVKDDPKTPGDGKVPGGEPPKGTA